MSGVSPSFTSLNKTQAKEIQKKSASEKNGHFQDPMKTLSEKFVKLWVKHRNKKDYSLAYIRNVMYNHPSKWTIDKKKSCVIFKMPAGSSFKPTHNTILSMYNKSDFLRKYLPRLEVLTKVTCVNGQSCLEIYSLTLDNFDRAWEIFFKLPSNDPEEDSAAIKLGKLIKNKLFNLRHEEINLDLGTRHSMSPALERVPEAEMPEGMTYEKAIDQAFENENNSDLEELEEVVGDDISLPNLIMDEIITPTQAVTQTDYEDSKDSDTEDPDPEYHDSEDSDLEDHDTEDEDSEEEPLEPGQKISKLIQNKTLKIKLSRLKKSKMVRVYCKEHSCLFSFHVSFTKEETISCFVASHELETKILKGVEMLLSLPDAPDLIKKIQILIIQFLEADSKEKQRSYKEKINLFSKENIQIQLLLIEYLNSLYLSTQDPGFCISKSLKKTLLLKSTPSQNHSLFFTLSPELNEALSRMIGETLKRTPSIQLSSLEESQRRGLRYKKQVISPQPEKSRSFALQNFSKDDCEELPAAPGLESFLDAARVSTASSSASPQVDSSNLPSAAGSGALRPGAPEELQALLPHSAPSAAPPSSEAYKKTSFTIDEVKPLKDFSAVREKEVLSAKLLEKRKNKLVSRSNFSAPRPSKAQKKIKSSAKKHGFPKKKITVLSPSKINIFSAAKVLSRIPLWVREIYNLSLSTSPKILKIIDTGAFKKSKTDVSESSSPAFQAFERLILSANSPEARHAACLSPHENLEIKRIPNDDPRESLRGQRGVFTKTLIKAGTIIGIYPGKLVHCNDLDPANNFIFSEPSPFNRLNIQPEVAITGRLLDSTYPAPLINAYTSHGVFKKDDSSSNSQKQNCEYAFYYPKGSTFPVLVVIATCDIPKGQELLSDYGEPYWKFFKEAQMNAKRPRMPTTSSALPILQTQASSHSSHFKQVQQKQKPTMEVRKRPKLDHDRCINQHAFVIKELTGLRKSKNVDTKDISI